jgi:TonB family protein
MLNRHLFIVFLALPSAYTELAYAGANGRHASRAPADIVSFDASIARLPTHYQGAVCQTVTRKLKSFSLAKSEYETTAAYAARMAALGGQRLDATRALSDLVGFVETADVGNAVYDADAGRLNVQVTWGQERLEVQRGTYRGTVLSETSVYEDAALVSNGFGASTRGSKSGRTVCALAFSNMPYMRGIPATFDVSVSLTPAQAKAAKPHLTLLYLGTIVAPYLGSYSRFQEATLDTPHQIVWNGDSVVLTLSEVWLFDRSTGTILHREPVGKQEANRALAAAPGGTGPVPYTTKHGGAIEMEGCRPEYPLLSRRQEETGTVRLSFLVTPEGQVRGSELVRSSGFYNLDTAARDALVKCRFQPALENGAPVATWVDVQYRFDLD